MIVPMAACVWSFGQMHQWNTMSWRGDEYWVRYHTPLPLWLTTEMCNTMMERIFCQLSGWIKPGMEKNCRPWTGQWTCMTNRILDTYTHQAWHTLHMADISGTYFISTILVITVNQIRLYRYIESDLILREFHLPSK